MGVISMTAVLFRITANNLVRLHAGSLLNCCISSRSFMKARHLPTDMIVSASALNGQKLLSKRILGDHSDSPVNESWSIAAYNLSEELKIEDVTLLSRRYEKYDLIELPHDLQHVAALLRLKKEHRANHIATTTDAQQPLNDVFVFREGTVVFWGVAYEQQMRILKSFSPLGINLTSDILMQNEREHLDYSLSRTIEKSKLSRDVVQLAIVRTQDELDLDQFAFSQAVSLSVKLAIWENMLEKYVQSISWVTNNIKTGEKIRLTRDQVFRKTGEVYEMKHRINLSSDLLDLPDIYWDRCDQETIFLSMTSFLNIKKRTSVMNEKLNNCCELMNLLAGHMNDRHHVRLEWMIIVLIMVEVSFEIARYLE